jgi:hypothetical protein
MDQSKMHRMVLWLGSVAQKNLNAVLNTAHGAHETFDVYSARLEAVTICVAYCSPVSHAHAS